MWVEESAGNSDVELCRIVARGLSISVMRKNILLYDKKQVIMII